MFGCSSDGGGGYEHASLSGRFKPVCTNVIVNPLTVETLEVYLQSFSAGQFRLYQSLSGHRRLLTGGPITCGQRKEGNTS
ncbi:hypothetical protein RRG08_013308 [Elysia crispata]|uniref:Uncharacterized protein n=1 Tax=Elysia crispata TaxID=231223 RepID=A0AAE1E7B8_9GAST|nr:hypothetical protein RRG08_013308 [Elysia crispata]